MSHIVCSRVRITDLGILKKALEKFPKLKFNEGVTRYKWYGRYANDYHLEDAAYHDGISPKDYGKCSHMISMEGANYQIGVVDRGDGSFTLIWDFYGRKYNGVTPMRDRHDGPEITDYLGHSAELLTAEYSREFIHDFATRNGFIMNETTDADGNLVLDMTVV